jgi:hypothetical protein
MKKSFVTFTAIGVIALTGIVSAPADAVQTIVVSPIPGDPVASGNVLLNAFVGLNPSSNNRITIKVEAGIYDLVDARLVMQPWIDLEGSGILSTKIQANGSSSIYQGTIMAASNSEIRDLKVVARGSDTNNIAILDSGVSSRIVNVAADAVGGDQCWGIRYLATSTTAWPTVRRSEITANCSSYNSGISSKSGNRPIIVDTNIRTYGAAEEAYNIGIFLDDGGMTTELRDVSIKAGDSTTPGVGISCGNPVSGTNWLEVAQTHIYPYGGIGISTEVPLSLKVRHSNIIGGRIGIQYKDELGPSYLQIHASVIGGSQYTIYESQFALLSTIKVAASQLDGGPVTVSGPSVKCVGVYDGGFNPLNSTCQ